MLFSLITHTYKCIKLTPQCILAFFC